MADEIDETRRANERFSNRAAIAIAVLATFVGLTAIKSGNVAQAIQQAQVDRNDNWAWYQAVRVREDMATYELSRLQQLARTSQSRPEAARIGAEITAQQTEITHIRARKDEVMGLARAAEARSDALNVFDDQYDISSALISIAMSLLAVCVLAQTRWLFWFSFLPAGAGLFFGVAAMVGMPVHAEALIRWLG
jgi:hypothetical protein